MLRELNFFQWAQIVVSVSFFLVVISEDFEVVFFPENFVLAVQQSKGKLKPDVPMPLHVIVADKDEVGAGVAEKLAKNVGDASTADAACKRVFEEGIYFGVDWALVEVRVTDDFDFFRMMLFVDASKAAPFQDA